MKLQKAIATLVSKQEMVKTVFGKEYLKYSIAVNDEYHFITSFAGTARYLNDYAIVGAKLFLDDWEIKKKEIKGKVYYDITANRVSVVKNGGK